jgi:hypothetical protein
LVIKNNAGFWQDVNHDETAVALAAERQSAKIRMATPSARQLTVELPMFAVSLG